jgi:hypothetical protein
MTGRNAMKFSVGECAIATVLTIGKTLMVATAGPRLGAAQIEHEW